MIAESEPNGAVANGPDDYDPIWCEHCGTLGIDEGQCDCEIAVKIRKAEEEADNKTDAALEAKHYDNV